MSGQLLTATDAARYLGVGLATFRRHVDAGRIPCWRDEDTGRRRYPLPALDAFLVSFAAAPMGRAS